VTQRDRAAVHVDLRQVDAELLLPREHDRGEGFIDLDEVDVLQRQARSLEDFLVAGIGRSAS